jgi:hypothetical protein
MTRAIAHGVATMFRHQRLALILWMWSLVIALAGAAPAIRWFGLAWPVRPQADTMLQAFDFPTYFDLSAYDTSPTWTLAMAAVGGAVLLAFVGGAFMSAATLHVLLGHDDTERTRTLWSRFGRGGGQAFWRSLGVSVINLCAVMLLTGLVLAAAAMAVRPFEDGPSEAAAWLAMVGPLVPAALVVAVLSAVADYARLRVVADPVCGALRAWFSALSFTLRHPLSTTVIWSVFAVMTALVLVASFTWSVTAPTHSTAWLAALVLVQQGVMLARAMIRVGVLGAEASYADARGFALPELPSALVDLLPQQPELEPERVERLDAGDRVPDEGVDQRPV